MKQEIMMWAVINNVTQEVASDSWGAPSLFDNRRYARIDCASEKETGNTAARVRRVKVTIEEAE